MYRGRSFKIPPVPPIPAQYINQPTIFPATPPDTPPESAVVRPGQERVSKMRGKELREKELREEINAMRENVRRRNAVDVAVAVKDEDVRQSSQRDSTRRKPTIRIMDFAATRNRGNASQINAQVTYFKRKGMEPDTSILVFGREFHVHSTMLRLYSTFLRTEIEAIEKEWRERWKEGLGTRKFRYEFESVLTGDDSGWGLVRAVEKPLSPPFTPASIPFTNGNGLPQHPQSQQITTFTHLLSTYYLKPPPLTTIPQLRSLVQLATQLGSLPCLSSSIYASLWSSLQFIQSIKSSPEEILLLATQLHHKLLFKESFIHTVSKWKGWSPIFSPEDGTQNRNLICCITKGRNGVLEKVVSVNNLIFEVLGRVDGDQEWGMSGLGRKVMEVLRGMSAGNMMGEREFYERLMEVVDEEVGDDEVEEESVKVLRERLREGLRGLLENKLVLDRVGKLEGQDGGGDGFLCADIQDGEYPWDEDEEEW